MESSRHQFNLPSFAAMEMWMIPPVLPAGYGKMYLNEHDHRSSRGRAGYLHMRWRLSSALLEIHDNDRPWEDLTKYMTRLQEVIGLAEGCLVACCELSAAHVPTVAYLAAESFHLPRLIEYSTWEMESAIIRHCLLSLRMQELCCYFRQSCSDVTKVAGVAKACEHLAMMLRTLVDQLDAPAVLGSQGYYTAVLRVAHLIKCTVIFLFERNMKLVGEDGIAPYMFMSVNPKDQLGTAAGLIHESLNLVETVDWCYLYLVDETQDGRLRSADYIPMLWLVLQVRLVASLTRSALMGWFYAELAFAPRYELHECNEFYAQALAARDHLLALQGSTAASLIFDGDKNRNKVLEQLEKSAKVNKVDNDDITLILPCLLPSGLLAVDWNVASAKFETLACFNPAFLAEFLSYLKDIPDTIKKVSRGTFTLVGAAKDMDLTLSQTGQYKRPDVTTPDQRLPRSEDVRFAVAIPTFETHKAHLAVLWEVEEEVGVGQIQ